MIDHEIDAKRIRCGAYAQKNAKTNNKKSIRAMKHKTATSTSKTCWGLQMLNKNQPKSRPQRLAASCRRPNGPTIHRLRLDLDLVQSGAAEEEAEEEEEEAEEEDQSD